MALTDHQRALISGRYIGQSTDFRTLPRTLAWENLVRAALQGLARISAPQAGKKQALRQPCGQSVAGTATRTARRSWRHKRPKRLRRGRSDAIAP